jgi:hypothetical protein
LSPRNATAKAERDSEPAGQSNQAAARDQNDVGAHTGEGQRHPPADAGGRAGHQRHPPFQRKDVERRRGHERHSTEVAGLMPGKYLRRRASAVRAFASMPSSREMRAVPVVQLTGTSSDDAIRTRLA